MSVDVRPLGRREIRAAAGVLGRAFYGDPVTMWMVPDNDARAKALPRGFATIARRHFLSRAGSEVASRAGVLGAATLWDPPGQREDSKLQKLSMLPGFLWAFGRRTARMEQIVRLMEEHHPDEPHWYLMLIGSDPTVRGAGFGQALMHSRLDRCDAEAAPAYLEASKPDLVPYYSRFGFEVTGEIKLPDGGPSMFTMWRNPR
ncbi:GNAT family N-acetyltransferase [Mycobacterium sp. NPDC048908]|uniref:GNAT family N-acetyltransferase n=1 Tax=Mycobacterium sp. NPDC048908 TaxID=3364292 RepID=UPI003718C0E8